MLMEGTLLLQSFIDTRPQPFLIADQNLRVVAVNRAFEIAFRITRKVAVGQHCFKAGHDRNRPCYKLGKDCPMEQMLRSKALHNSHTSQQIRQNRERYSTNRAEFEHYPLQDVDGNFYIAEDLSMSVAQTSDSKPRLIGSSRAFLDVLEELAIAAKSQIPILLTGETGTGKELAAQYIHDNSTRGEKPFLVLDCTVLSENLFESEVFGHKRGAFTDSIDDRKGLIELAQGGTLLLDEIGEIPPALQPKLLRVLDSGEYRRVGETQIRRADVRIIGATNRNLHDLRSFRRDLYYRIACTTIRLPPLRKRSEDIPELTRVLLEHIGASVGKTYQIEPEAIELLRQYVFPGNIRELRNILWEAISRSHSHLLLTEFVAEVLNTVHAVSSADKCSSTETRQQAIYPIRRLDDSMKLQDNEREQVVYALQRHRGNRRKTADALGISERTLYRKLSRYQM